MRIRVPLALPLLPGDRFVLRESGRAETVGGGGIVEIAPVRPVSKAHPDRSIERIVAERGPILPEDLEALTGERRAATFGRWLVAPERVAEISHSVAQAVADAGPARPPRCAERSRPCTPLSGGRPYNRCSRPFNGELSRIL